MLYLNNPLLTSERIIAHYEKMLNQPDIPGRPSQLVQLKDKLKANFFEQLAKTTSDEEVLAQLQDDERFISNYPKLKQVLSIIFSSKDTDDKQTALNALKAIGTIDWDTTSASAKFNELNTQYGYFQSSEHLQTLFTELAKSCRTQIVLFEKNNTPDDTMAYDYAYKLMALYVDPQHPEKSTLDVLSKDIYKLMNNIDNDKEHPFHEALLVQLANLPRADQLSDRTGWSNLLRTHGINAAPFLVMAEQIEEKIKEQPGETGKRAPENLSEANAMYKLCRYKRADKDDDFATLCHRYKVPEDMFEASLNYLDEPPGWPKKNKDHDNIPDLTIKGQGEAEGLYWVKLPITDKRALILGQITDCCQSIGGHSAQCVKDAVSLNDNGLYVLMKQKRKGNPVWIIDGQINEKDFKIIGQSYVWKSLTGNLCLDSIECLKGKVSDDAIKRIMTDFADQVLKIHPDIKWVTVGQGGKTPKSLFVEAKLPEHMCQGEQYPDSCLQYCIATSSRLANDAQRETLQKIFPGYPDYCIDYLSSYIMPNDENRFWATLQALFIEHTFATPIVNFIGRHPAFDSMTYGLVVAFQAGLLADKNAILYIQLLISCRLVISAARQLAAFRKTGLLDGDKADIYFSVLIEHKRDPGYCVESLFLLKEAGLLDDEKSQTYLSMVKTDTDGNGMALALCHLKRAGLLDDKNALRYLIAVKNAKHQAFVPMADILILLKKSDFLDGDKSQANLDLLNEQWRLSNLFCVLQFIEPLGFLSGEKRQANFELVVKLNNLDNYLLALKYLGKLNLLSGGKAQENFEWILKQQKPNQWIHGMEEINEAGLLNDENAQFYVETFATQRYPFAMGEILVALKSSGLLNEDNAKIYVDALVKYPDIGKLSSDLDSVTEDQRKDFLCERLKNYITDLKQGRDIIRTYKEAIAQPNNETETSHMLSGDSKKL